MCTSMCPESVGHLAVLQTLANTCRQMIQGCNLEQHLDVANGVELTFCEHACASLASSMLEAFTRRPHLCSLCLVPCYLPNKDPARNPQEATKTAPTRPPSTNQMFLQVELQSSTPTPKKPAGIERQVEDWHDASWSLFAVRYRRGVSRFGARRRQTRGRTGVASKCFVAFGETTSMASLAQGSRSRTHQGEQLGFCLPFLVVVMMVTACWRGGECHYLQRQRCLSGHSVEEVAAALLVGSEAPRDEMSSSSLQKCRG